MTEEHVEGWRMALAAELDRRAARAAVRRDLAESRQWGLRQRRATRLGRVARQRVAAAARGRPPAD
jgi:hypothetical protein